MAELISQCKRHLDSNLRRGSMFCCTLCVKQPEELSVTRRLDKSRTKKQFDVYQRILPGHHEESFTKAYLNFEVFVQRLVVQNSLSRKDVQL